MKIRFYDVPSKLVASLRILAVKQYTWYLSYHQFSNTYNHNDPKFLDIKVWANSTDPDRTAPVGAV